MITTHMRGHKIYYDGETWRYADTHAPADDSRPCAKCGEMPTPEGYDPCIGYVPGAVSVCCGHGVAEPICVMEEGSQDTTRSGPGWRLRSLRRRRQMRDVPRLD